MLIRNPFILSPVLIMVLIMPLNAGAQAVNDSTMVAGREKKVRPISDPSRAAMLSAALPGLGQVYNRRHWKVPIIYAGFGALAYNVRRNNELYQTYRVAYLARVDGNPNTTDNFPQYSAESLERAVNVIRRNLEVTYLIAAALYLLNILEASVDAHLMDFDVGEKLSFGIQPIQPPMYLRNVPSFNGAGLSVRFSF